MVNWTERARLDLKDIYDYIKRDSLFYSKKVVKDIIEKAKKIDDFPKKGRAVPEIQDESLREVFIYSYRIIYKIYKDRIDVISVLHGARNIFKSI